MPEFMFRNLSVKLYPAEGNESFDWRNPWTCWATPTTQVIYCPDPSTEMSYCDPTSTHFCDSASRWGSFVDPNTAVVIPAGADLRQELTALKANMQKEMAVVDARLAEIESAAKPNSVEQIDSLKSQLLAAVDELDQQRAQLEDGGQAPG